MKKTIKKVLLFVLALCMTTSVITLQAASDTSFSASITQEYASVGDTLSLSIEGANKELTYNWKVNGNNYSNEATITVTSEMENALIEVSVSDGVETISDRMMVSNLPVVFIDTEDNAPIVSKEDYINANMSIQSNERYESILSDPKKSYDGLIEIRGRGNSTWGQPKKPYKIKLDSKTDLFGMGKNKHWVLLANYLDESLLRNQLSYNLSGDLGMPYMASVLVEVVLNGERVGNYQLCEQIRVDSTRVDVFDWESYSEDMADAISSANDFAKADKKALESLMSEDYSWMDSGKVTYNNVEYNISDYAVGDLEMPNKTGGYIFELDEYYDEISKFKTDRNQPIMFKNPEFAITSNDLFNYAKEYVQAVENAFTNTSSYTTTYDGETKHYTDLVDEQSFIDFWLINEIFFNEDFMKKSTYFYQEVDGKLFAGPIWDMDWAADGEGNTSYYNRWQTQYFSASAQANQWYKSLVNDPYFLIKARERYNTTVKPLLEEMIKNGGTIDMEKAYLASSGAYNSQYWYRNSNAFTNNVNKLKTYLTNRKGWLDTQFASKASILNSFSINETVFNATITSNNENVVFDETGVATLKEGQGVSITINNANGTYQLLVNGKVVENVTATNAQATFTLTNEELMVNKGINVVAIKQNGRQANYIFDVDGEVDSSALQALVDQASAISQGEYSDESFNNLQAVIEEANALLAKDVLLKSEANAMISKLQAAIDALKEADVDENKLINTQGSNKVSIKDFTSQCTRENTNETALAEYTLDYNEQTHWHSDYVNDRTMPQYITYDLGDEYILNDITFLPRQNGQNGDIFEAEVYVSLDGENFTKHGDTFQFENNGRFYLERDQFKRMNLGKVNARYVRVSAIKTGGSSIDAYASIAEIRFYGTIYDGSVDVDKTLLQAAINQAKDIDATKYTLASIAVLDEALRQAHSVNDDLNTTQEAINQALDNLNKALAALELIKEDTNLINKTATSISVVDFSSECDEELEEDGIGSAVSTLDKNYNTYWHSNYIEANGMPQYITYDLGAIYDLEKINFVPRQNGTNGDIFQAKLYVGENEEELTLVGTYDFDNDGNYLVNRSLQTINFKACGRYVKFEVVKAGGNQLDEYCSMSEIEFFGQIHQEETPKVDKSALQQAISEADALDSNDYTNESYAEFVEALNSAKATLANENATQEEVNAQVNALAKAKENLVLKPVEVNKEALRKAIEDAKNVDTTNKTPESLAALTSIISVAEVLLADENATQAQVDEAVKVIRQAIDDLETIKVDKANLQKAIEEAQKGDITNKTQDSIDALNEAISKAESVLANENATQNEVDAATKALTDAINALVEKPVVNKADLEKAIEEAEKVDTTNKTAESVAALTSAITSAKEVLADEKATQDAVDAAVKALNDAVANLKDIEVKPEYKGYDDVDSEAWYAGMVQEATIKGLMGKDGSTGNNFNPDGKITRGMVATVLYRMAGEPKVTYADKFSDVKDGLWYSNGIVWASEAKVVSGYANGKFGPDDAIKREDFAIMLRNYANTCGLNTKSSQSLETFKDYKAVSAYAKDAIAWCVENGLMSGSKKGEEKYLNPSANTTRAEAAKMFVQLSNLIKK